MLSVSVATLTKDTTIEELQQLTKLDIELIENMYVANILAPLNVMLPVGTPLAVLTDELPPEMGLEPNLVSYFTSLRRPFSFPNSLLGNNYRSLTL
jgi:hypothetical protein